MTTNPLVQLGAGKAREGIVAVRGSDQPCLAEIVLGSQVAHLGIVWPVDDANGDGEDGVALPGEECQLQSRCGGNTENAYLCLVPNSIINHTVVLDNLLLGGILQILDTSIHLIEVDVAEAPVEQNLARVELEQQTQLRIVDQSVATEVEEGVVEVGKGLFVVLKQEVGNSLLEIGHGEVLVELDCALVALDL